MSFATSLRAIILGAPGAGKGTVLSKLSRQYQNQLTTVSSGDLLREQIKHNPSSEIASVVASGRLVPNNLMIDMIFNRFDQLDLFSQDKSWLLDGFPRNVNQAIDLDSRLLHMNNSLNLVIELDVPYEVILNRIKNRYIHQPSGRIYSLDYNPPKVPGKDDVTGEPLTKRPDDNVEVFAQRLELYTELVEPLKDYYADRDLLHTISGDSSDIIYPQLLKLVEKKFNTPLEQ